MSEWSTNERQRKVAPAKKVMPGKKIAQKKIVPARKSCAKGKEVFAKWIQPQYDVVHVHLWC